MVGKQVCLGSVLKEEEEGNGEIIFLCHLVFNYTEVGTLKFSEKNKKKNSSKSSLKKKTLGKVNVWDLGEGTCIMYSLYLTADGLIDIQSTILQAFY